ncbi:MAG: HAMP domain-containing histidine kinase [Melioribacteraceae bacterium]|nr:HAMP domain-containing histidine kinase [Melioribacteraceae bacterium]MCO6474056.1 HAMP domain-containing histidine kinase [Melioribacteraceae bacterium]MDD3557091.1 HAMP domain-containing sensor histidine kinase [Melioribacteraceae bacterium]
MASGPKSFNLKIVLLIIAFAIALGTLYYTQNIVQKLQLREKNIVELYANSLQYLATSDEQSEDYTFIFDVIRRIDFPLILTDPNDKVNLSGMAFGIRNVEYDSTLTQEELISFIDEKIVELSKEHSPIPVTIDDTLVVQKIYYGNSDLIKQLIYYPYLQILSAIIFILISYVSFSYMKKTEQSNIWVGMAKETAHQLGTPISSLMGWSEMLKLNYNYPDKVSDVADEMDNDLTRLNKIAKRFSKIGSNPELKENNIYEIINGVADYFKRRLPQFGHLVQILITGNKNIVSKVNADLFEWVLENLIKNSLDAIENKEGKIEIDISELPKTIEISVTDNGKGIDIKRRKDIFRPGYSTKKRGWGLGLSLSKRIISDYHKGKIFVSRSEIDNGTTIKIILPK